MRPILLATVILAMGHGKLSSAPPARDVLEAAINRSAAYLIRHTKQDGSFVYRINLDHDVRVAPKYNMLRHAGTIYALSDYHRWRSAPSTRQVMKKAGRFLQSQVANVGELPDVLAVWSDPKINLGDDPRKAKLGGTGLGLVALAGLESIESGFTSESELRQLGNFLLFMQKDDGAYYSFYHPVFPGRDDAWTSLYYPGEAALGLLLLHQVHPDPEWIQGASEALAFLARSRSEQDRVPPDHWSLIATAQLLSLPEEERQAVDRNLLISHAVQICRQLVAEQRPQNGLPGLQGSFTPDGRTTPTATRLEGLLAIRGLLPSDKYADLTSQIELACDRGIRFLLQAQIKQGAGDGGVPRAIARLAKDDPNWSESFNERATEIRIDYVQHALSAWIHYHRQLIGRHGSR